MMRWAVTITSLVFVGAGSGLAVGRALLTDTPVIPKEAEHVWEVELEAVVKGPGRGKVAVHLPVSGDGQEVLSAQPQGERLRWTVRDDEVGRRIAVWRGASREERVLRYRMRVRTLPLVVTLPTAPAAFKIPELVRKTYLEFTSDKAVNELLKKLNLPPRDDPAGIARLLFSFVNEQVATEALGPDDPNEVLTERYGSSLGKARLLAMLARASGLPARTVLGLEPRDLGEADVRAWVEMWFADGWAPMDADGDFFAERPRDLIAVRIDNGRTKGFIETEGRVRLVEQRALVSPVRYSHRLAADEMVSRNLIFGSVSLYALPLSTQSSLRLLLLLPLGALVVSIARVGIGLKTFGGFLPVLLALAFRETSLLVGLALTAGLVAVGIFGRAVLSPLNLLHFPRSAFILCLVVVGVVGSALLGQRFGQEELLVGVLFPIVILSLLIERFSLTLEEEGIRSALSRTFTTIIVIALVHPVMNQPWLTYLLFSFPELLFVVMGLLIMVGGYTGYRLLDYWRFRSLARAQQAGAAA